MTKRKQAARITKKKIYQSAITLIKEKGYDNVLIEDITEMAGVSKGSFYTHFPSKEDILIYTYSEISKGHYETLKDLLFLELSFDEILISFIRRIYTETDNRGRELTLAIITRFNTPRFKDTLLNSDRSFFVCINKILDIGFERKEIDPALDKRFAVLSIFNMLNGIEHYWTITEDSDTQLADLAENSITLLMDGLKRK